MVKPKGEWIQVRKGGCYMAQYHGVFAAKSFRLIQPDRKIRFIGVRLVQRE